jgi:O-6-methylguanine DNA methyltransferase
VRAAAARFPMEVKATECPDPPDSGWIARYRTLRVGAARRYTALMTQLATAEIECPLGSLRVAATDIGVVKISFPGGPRSDFVAWLAHHVPGAERVSTLPTLEEALAELRSYFDGRLREFKVGRDLRGGTEFQLRVWKQLAQIPYGETWTYGELARRVGRPGASRAVGAANGANPLPLILPCHRVVASGGKLGGFGGGLDAKRRLLAFERIGNPLLS